MADKIEQALVIFVVDGFVIGMLFVSVSWVAASVTAASRCRIGLSDGIKAALIVAATRWAQ